MSKSVRNSLIIILFFPLTITSYAQIGGKDINWTSDGTAYLEIRNSNIVRKDLPANKETVLVTKEQLTPKGSADPLVFSQYEFSPD